MNYILNHGGMEYELPKFTKSVKIKMDRINTNNESSLPEDKKFKDMYLFIKEEVGAESAREIFGTDNLDEMDLNDIAVCYIEIANAYAKPVDDAEKHSQNIKNRLSDILTDEDRELFVSIFQNADSLDRLTKNMSAKKMTGFGPASKRI